MAEVGEQCIRCGHAGVRRDDSQARSNVRDLACRDVGTDLVEGPDDRNAEDGAGDKYGDRKADPKHAPDSAPDELTQAGEAVDAGERQYRGDHQRVVETRAPQCRVR